MEFPVTQAKAVPTAKLAGKPSIISAGVTTNAPPTPANPLRIPAPRPIKMRRNMLISTPGNTAKLIMRDYFLHAMINPEFRSDISPQRIE
jgi:hypothetical protein